MAKSLLNLVNRKLRKRLTESVRLAVKADESDREDLKQALMDAGVDDIEETEDGLTVKAIGDMEDTVREVCDKYECACESEEDPDEEAEDEVDEDDEYYSDSDAEVKKSTEHPEVDEEEDPDEEDDEDQNEEEEDDVDEEEDPDEEDDEDQNEEEEDDVDEEDNEPGQDSHDVGTQKAHPNEEEDDDDVDEADDEDDVDEEEEDPDEEDDEDQNEEDDCKDCKDAEEVKECIHNHVREDIRTIARTMKLDEKLLSQVETSFIAALERRARSVAKIYSEHKIEKIKRQTRKDLRKINENINKYITYAAKEWIAENKVAIESKLKVRLAENLINDINSTLKENAITAPSATNTLKKYSAKISKLESDLNKSRVEVLERKARIDVLESAIIVDDVASRYGLSEVQKENFMQVVKDSVDITAMSRKDYMKHVEVMAEMYVGGKKALKESSKPTTKTKKSLSRKDIYMKYLGQDKFF